MLVCRIRYSSENGTETPEVSGAMFGPVRRLADNFRRYRFRLSPRSDRGCLAHDQRLWLQVGTYNHGRHVQEVQELILLIEGVDDNFDLAFGVTGGHGELGFVFGGRMMTRTSCVKN